MKSAKKVGKWLTIVLKGTFQTYSRKAACLNSSRDFFP